jgi:hypothetical protein
MSKVLTDNSFLRQKVQLRVDNLPDKDPVMVLDMYAGYGRVWDQVRKITGRDIEVLGIEKKKITGKIYLQGDNTKYDLDYDQFDVIDLDAYGVPFTQIEQIMKRTRKELIIFVTFIQSQWGVLPRGLLKALGYTPAMIKKIPTMFNRNGQQKLLQYLGSHGIKSVKIYHTADLRKNYLCFKINEPPK